MNVSYQPSKAIDGKRVISKRARLIIVEASRGDLVAAVFSNQTILLQMDSGLGDYTTGLDGHGGCEGLVWYDAASMPAYVSTNESNLIKCWYFGKPEPRS